MGNLCCNSTDQTLDQLEFQPGSILQRSQDQEDQPRFYKKMTTALYNKSELKKVIKAQGIVRGFIART